MQIQTDTDAIQNALDIISKTAPPLEGEVTFRAIKGRLTCMSVADLSRCQVVVPCMVDSDGEFAILMQSLRDATKGRKTLNLSYKEGTLTVKAAGGYAAELATLDVIPVDESPKDETKDWKLTGEQAVWLRKALKEVTLKPTSILSSWMPVGIKLSKIGGFVCCYDTQHMSWVNNKEAVGDFECVLPIETAKAIVEVFHQDEFSVSVASSFIRVRNKLVNVILSVPNTDEIPSLEEVRVKIKEAMAEKSTTFSLSQTDMIAFIDNAKAVVGKERAEIIVSSAKGKNGNQVELLVKTGQGTVRLLVSGGVGASRPKTFRVDLEYIQELIARADQDLKLNVVDGSFLSMKLTGGFALVALNQ
jgi:hypothetical protein